MIYAELKRLSTVQVDAIVDDGQGGWAPRDRRYFSILVDASIGPKGHDGEDLFQFDAVSPAWLMDEANGGVRWLRHRMLLAEWDYRVVWNTVEKLCTSVSGETWDEVAAKLATFMTWEFEGYDGGR